MKTLLIAGLLGALGAIQAHAATYGGDIRFVDLDVRGSKGQVQEYNGQLYRGAHADVFLSEQGTKGLIDLDFRDIGSGEENGSLNADLGDWFKGYAKYDRMTHRQNFTDFGIVINGDFVKIPANLTRNHFVHDLDMLYKRTELETGLAFFDPENTARWISLQYWGVVKKGTSPSGYYTGGVLQFAEADVDNETNEITVGAGHEAGKNGALALDVIRREFKDLTTAKRFGNITSAIRPKLPDTQMTAAEMRFRYDASKKLALTGALTGRQRENRFNLYKANAAVAALNAAYKASPKLSLTARLHWRLLEVDENNDFRNVVSNNPRANMHQIDFMTARGDFQANYKPVERLKLTAGYKVQLSHRRDAPQEPFGAASYTDGTLVAAHQHINSVAGEDVKHILSAGMSAELPLGISADADYKRLQANRAAFVNSPTQGDEVNGSLRAALPGAVELYAMAQYLSERNSIQMTHNRLTRNAYRAGLDWEAANKVFIGADASHEVNRRHTDGWFGASGNTNPAATGFEHIDQMYNRQVSDTTGLHGRFNLPAGVVLKTSGSYTWSRANTPMDMRPRTDPGFQLQDITPNDVRIARGSVGVDYTPSKYKNLTAYASYRVDHWVEKYDPTNNGRASYTRVGVSAKF